MKMLYRNYRGEFAVRDLAPEGGFDLKLHPENGWHGKNVWILDAFDYTKGGFRDFALKDTCFLRPTEGLGEVIAERVKQEGKGWDTEHDRRYTCNELEMMARCYLQAATMCESCDESALARIPCDWPRTVDVSWWRPEGSRRANLVKATALSLAALEATDP